MSEPSSFQFIISCCHRVLVPVPFLLSGNDSCTRCSYSSQGPASRTGTPVCGAVEESWNHIVFECPRFEAIRAELLGRARYGGPQESGRRSRRMVLRGSGGILWVSVRGHDRQIGHLRKGRTDEAGGNNNGGQYLINLRLTHRQNESDPDKAGVAGRDYYESPL